MTTAVPESGTEPADPLRGSHIGGTHGVGAPDFITPDGARWRSPERALPEVAVSSIAGRLAQLDLRASVIAGCVKQVRLHLGPDQESRIPLIQDPLGHFGIPPVDDLEFPEQEQTDNSVRYCAAIPVDPNLRTDATQAPAPLPVPHRITKRDYNYFNQLHSALARLGEPSEG